MIGAIDNVAHAITDAQEKFGTYPVPAEFIAERAILAMRHPTDEMMAVFTALPQHHNRLDMWCAMIDVALGRLVFDKSSGDDNE